MKRSSILKMLPFAIVILALLITGIAWQTHPGNNKQTKTDTIPEKKKKIRDIDDAIEELEKSKAEVDRSIKEIEWPKINEEIRASLKDVHVDMEKIKTEVQHAIKEIEKSISVAHAGIEKARKELIGYKNFINELDKDGLINKKSNYTIKYKKGELFINDKKQPAEVVNKYHSYLNGHKDFTIKKEKDDFDINNEDDDN